MKPIVKLEGNDLRKFLDTMESVCMGDDGGTPVYRIRFAFDAGQLKMKVNEYTWTPGYGEQEA